MIKRKEFEELFQPSIEQRTQIWEITRVKELSQEISTFFFYQFDFISSVFTPIL